MSAVPRHSKKEIEEALEYARQKGWRIEKANGHAWGRLYCPYESREGCHFSVWSTPRSAANEAKRIRRLVDKCECPEMDDEDKED